MSDDAVGQTQVTSSTEAVVASSGQDPGDGGVCRDYLRNVCRRGERCRFLHPVDLTSARRDVIAAQSSRRGGGVIFCHDFQNAAGCRRGAACRYASHKETGAVMFRRSLRAFTNCSAYRGAFKKFRRSIR